MVMDVLQIPLLFAYGVLALVLIGLGYEMASAWLSYRKASRRWSK
ncbi:hypothetical protein [Thermococcus sp. ES12]|nr:hypothetical protein [Thermococcus sp. ES12]